MKWKLAALAALALILSGVGNAQNYVATASLLERGCAALGEDASRCLEELAALRQSRVFDYNGLDRDLIVRRTQGPVSQTGNSLNCAPDYFMREQDPSLLGRDPAATILIPPE